MEAGAAACRAQWSLFLVWGAAEVGVISEVSGQFCKAHVAMNGFAKEAIYRTNLLF